MNLLNKCKQVLHRIALVGARDLSQIHHHYGKARNAAITVRQRAFGSFVGGETLKFREEVGCYGRDQSHWNHHGLEGKDGHSSKSCVEETKRTVYVKPKVAGVELSDRCGDETTKVSMTKPCMILGGMSLVSFQALFPGLSPIVQLGSQCMTVHEERDQDPIPLTEVREMNAKLFDENEELHDLCRDLTQFIEKQKDEIERLETQLAQFQY